VLLGKSRTTFLVHFFTEHGPQKSFPVSRHNQDRGNRIPLAERPQKFGVVLGLKPPGRRESVFDRAELPRPT
jgi:hypothetical protein